MENVLLSGMLTQFGGLGAVVAFAYILLRATLKQQEKLTQQQKELTEVVKNHFQSDIEAKLQLNQVLTEILNKLEK